MQSSEKVAVLIRKYIGFHPDVYKPADRQDAAFIGYGHRITGEKEWAAIPITKAQAEVYLALDISNAESILNTRWRQADDTDQARYDMACVLVHCLGSNRMVRSWLLKYFARGEDVVAELTRWATAMPEHAELFADVAESLRS